MPALKLGPNSISADMSSSADSQSPLATGTTTLLLWSKKFRVRLFATGLLMVMPGLLLWWGIASELSIVQAIKGLLVPQMFLGMAVLPVWGCTRMVMALMPTRTCLQFDEQGLTHKSGRRRTHINWEDITQVAAVDAVKRIRFVNPGASGFGLLGAAVASPASYDKSVATSKTGRSAGIELSLKPNRYEGRNSYWIADQFEINRESVARLIERYKCSFPTAQRPLQTDEGSVLTMVQLREFANYSVVYVALGGPAWLLLVAFVVLLSRSTHEHVPIQTPPVMTAPSGDITARPAVRLHPTSTTSG